MKYLVVVSFLFFFTCSYGLAKQRNVSSTEIADTTAPLPLKKFLRFPIGAAVKVQLLRDNAAYRNLVINNFNSITAENAMKFNSLHPAPTVFTWKDADYIVDFAIQNNIRVHGHTLLWTKYTPKWVTNFNGSRSEWQDLLKYHIQTIVSHFKGKVHSWDVMNEAFDDKGNLIPCIWLEKLGPEYIELAFRYAHECDPTALLFYNDYGQEFAGRKLQAIMAMVQDFKRRGVPISGLGLQMHTVLRMSTEQLAKAIQSAASTGLKVHISELEISVRYQKPESFLLDSVLESQQAQKYIGVFQAYMRIPRVQQFGITTWNVSDADSFRNSKIRNHDFPLLFDMNFKPKAAYRALVNEMRKKR
jgi:endo-1,4-beta-xylanase